MKVYIGVEQESGLVVSSDGKIYREVTQWSDRDGYMYVTYKGKNLAVHRLVGKVFVPGMSEENKIVMHKDDNPKNNVPENLKWGTHSQNNFDAYAHGLKTTNKYVRCMETGEVFNSAREAATKMFGIPKRGDHILMVIQQKRGVAYGYHLEVVPR